MKTKISSTKFKNYQEMSQSAKNWDHHCSYRLSSHAFEGKHHVIALPQTQLSYSYREGGFMHDAISPPDSISIAVIQECQEQACFDKFILRQGMVLFFDDSQAFNYMSKGKIKTAIVSIPKEIAKQYSLDFMQMYGKFLEDENALFSILFEKILQKFLSNDSTLDLEEAQAELIAVLHTLMKTQIPQDPKLTKGEKTALAIRDQVYHHMDGKINIESFSRQYKVSEQTLQNAFKSLFGFTPKRFLQLLKLNLVHHDLQNTDPSASTVLRIASKWGFTHMGRFSEAYTELFGENPSLTLKSLDYIKGNMISSCTSRKEEMT